MNNDSVLPFVEQIQDQATRQAVRSLAGMIDSLRRQTSTPSGTLDPDQKTTGLGIRDVGALFYSTDFDRTYVWNGSAWQDAQGAPIRGQIGFFPPDADPGVGWVQATGSLVVWSTSDGRTENKTVPSIPAYQGQAPWVRV